MYSIGKKEGKLLATLFILRCILNKFLSQFLAMSHGKISSFWPITN